MNEIVAIVEGLTEQTFVRNQLAPHLGFRGIAIWPVLSGRTRKQGGVSKWVSACRDIIRTLKEGRYCTTMFDFYTMPADWPGRTEAAMLSWDQRGHHVKSAILKSIAAHVGGGFNPAQLIPYAQVHEFEALMFADVEVLAEVSAPLCSRDPTTLGLEFKAILETATNAEAIDDGYATCPSRRIMNLVPGYRKRAHSPIVAQRAGLEKLRSACGHFADWLARLKAIAPSA